MSNDVFPPLKRQIEAVQIDHDAKPMIMLRDLEEISEAPLAVSPGGFLIAMMFDGKAPLTQICGEFMQKTGQMIPASDVANLARQLDNAFLLESSRLASKRKEIFNAFKSSSVRPPAFAGLGYPKDPMELGAQLGTFYNDPVGPKKTNASQPTEKEQAAAVLAPHIDFARGGPSYAWAYQRLSEFPAPDVVVGFGVAHQSPNSPWIFLNKAYETPYGNVLVEPELYDRLARHLWYAGDVDDFIHRREHSLEFQALWMRYLWREAAPAWVPILCSSFDRFAPDFSPAKVDTIRKALDGFADEIGALQKAGKRVLLLGGVDLAHVGKRFGDQFDMDEKRRKEVEAEDRASLAHVLSLEPDEFYLSVVNDGHKRKWCGLSAIYSILYILKKISPEVRGELLSYDQADDPMGGIVSFTSIVFKPDGGTK